MAGITETSWIWHDGTYVKWADAQVHVLSHSMQFGSAVFEGIRCYSTPNGPAVFRLREHLQRLLNSCKIYRMDVKYSLDDLMRESVALIAKNEMTSCYFRPMVIRGYGASGMVPFESPVEVYLPCWPWGAYLGDEALEKGVDACISTWNRVAPNTIPAAAKIAGNYLSGQLIKMEALANGFQEGIALSPGGMVSEGSGQNLFLVHGGVLYTPPIDGTLLTGITRDTIIKLARDAGIAVVEKPLPRDILYIADEVFLSGTASEVTPVRSIDRLNVGDGKVGPMTRQLQKEYLGICKGEIADRHGWLTPVK
ncbi:MAG: branched-chain amino acid transaminase [Phycisphaerae bacterium]|nr:branched-chain amino acid transaminase [Gemmatimonadaceae bacterium]